MRQIVKTMAVLMVGCGLTLAGAMAQGTVALDRGPEAFASENAILDTAIPFAIGAREARQALRGAFGWPSFQEGLVEGVYFRFDPDGYARFAPTPRLDVDVFEVICRPRTYACAARKEGMEVFLTDRGQLQVKLEHALAGDQFFVSEGVSEIQLPERVLQPLDMPLELLLGAGGELTTRRGGSEVARVSLKGFSAVTAYLRWIAARQDYAVLPRGWPVPNLEAGLVSGTMTQPSAWNSPMPQPQVVAPAMSAPYAGIAPATTAAPLTVYAPDVAPVSRGGDVAAVPSVTGASRRTAEAGAPQVLGRQSESEVDALRQELEVIKTLLTRAQPDLEMAARPQTFEGAGAATMQDSGREQSMGQLLLALERLQADVAALKNREVAVEAGAELWRGDMNADGGAEVGNAEPPTPDTAQQLAFLTRQMGFDAQTALAVLKMSEAQTKNGVAEAAPDPVQALQPQTLGVVGNEVMYEQALVDEILAEMEAEMAASGLETAAPAHIAASDQVAEYQLLSSYFASAALPKLQQLATQAEVFSPVSP